jgi:hypothetical protein
MTEWRLYFVRKGVGLEYALHNKGAWRILSHLHAKFRDGERISENWKLILGYYTGSPQEEYLQLTETMFTDPNEFKSLTSKCFAADKNFNKDATAAWDPYFVHVPTRKRLPLGMAIDSDWEDISKYVQRQLDEGLSGKDRDVSFSSLSDEVFV